MYFKTVRPLAQRVAEGLGRCSAAVRMQQVLRVGTGGISAAVGAELHQQVLEEIQSTLQP